MVNADEPALRANRLALLAALHRGDEPRGRPVEAGHLNLRRRGPTMQPSLNLVILGRDGILNEYRDDHVKSPDEWVPVPGALEAVARLNHAGWHVVVATNQSGIGRGMIDMASVNAVHAHMMRCLHGWAGASTRCSSARTRPRTPATAASRCRA